MTWWQVFLEFAKALISIGGSALGLWFLVRFIKESDTFRVTVKTDQEKLRTEFQNEIKTLRTEFTAAIAKLKNDENYFETRKAMHDAKEESRRATETLVTLREKIVSMENFIKTFFEFTKKKTEKQDSEISSLKVRVTEHTTILKTRKP